MGQTGAVNKDVSMADAIAHAVTAGQRFGLGLKPGMLEGLARDPRRAVLDEIDQADLAGIAAGDLLSGQQAMQAHFEERHGPQVRMDAPATARRSAAILQDEAIARFAHGMRQSLGFVERLVLFWSNHFCVSVRKGPTVRVVAGAYEREAIRPHVLGDFAAMLTAVVRHPTMLVYLDNRGSIGPTSRAGLNRKRGLNENLAREILELHTLGVDGGYSQRDVGALARMLTGWTVAGPDGRAAPPGAFVFNPNAHEPGPQTLLGRAYAAGGADQAEAALANLALHPATARFIARKFARHFVADDPPPALVARLEADFRRTGGNLGSLARVLVTSEEAWTVPATKVRTPYEFLLAASRATGVAPANPSQVLGPLNAMGQPLWAPAGPNGHPDTAGDIAAPEAMTARLEAASVLARRMRGAAADPRALQQALFGDLSSPDSRQAVIRAESAEQGLALLFLSPEFLRR